MMNNISEGYKAELAFPLLCWDKKWEVAKPLHEFLPYDFLVKGITLKAKRWYTIQIKKAYKYKNRKRVDIRKKAQNKKVSYEKGDFDYLFIFDDEDNEWYKIPYSVISHIKTEISLNKYVKYKIKA